MLRNPVPTGVVIGAFKAHWVRRTLAGCFVVYGLALGGSALFALSIGMGAPLILFGVSAGKLVPRAGGWMNAVKAAFGVAMLGLSIWMLERILPGGVIMVLWGLLAVGCAVGLWGAPFLETVRKAARQHVQSGRDGDWRRFRADVPDPKAKEG